MTGDATQIPLLLKLGYTLFVAGLVPIYLRHYGPANFLWFSTSRSWRRRWGSGWRVRSSSAP